MNQRVAIVAAGARTPLGLGLASSAAAVRGRISALSAHPYMVDSQGEPVRGAIDALIPPLMQGADRLFALASGALDDLLNTWPAGAAANRVLPTLLAVPEHRPGFGPADEALLLQQLDARACMAISTRVSARGHAGALHSIGLACDWIAACKMDLCLVGGVDSYFHPDTLDWLVEGDQLAMDNRRTGFHPGEGAGFVALVSERQLRTDPELSVLAWVRGHSSALETSLIKADEINHAKALTQAVEGAARGLQPGEALDQIWCDINGERYRTDEWSYVLLRSPHVFRRRHGEPTDYHTTADLSGDVGAAGGALMVGLALRAWGRHYDKGPFALVFAGSEGGLRSAVVLQAGNAA
jgi:3-oxoacyl-[acyl-carrier-protein] synthase-1